jgi:hypothetical protein
VVVLAGDCGARIAGSDRFNLRSWALVVVGSLRRETVEDLLVIAVLRGVDGGRD